MIMAILHYTLPAHWAHPLINNDWTGVDQRESDAICAFLEAEGLRAADCVGCEEIGFQWRHDATEYCDFPSGGQMEQFAFTTEGN